MADFLLILAPLLLTMAAGAVIGSFLNVLIHRGPAMWGLVDDVNRRGNLIRPRSYCPSCGARIPPHHLIPILSFIALRGQCAACKAKIPFRYLFVEIAGALAALFAVLIFGFTLEGFGMTVFFLFLIALAAIDAETGFLPDGLTVPLIALGIVANLCGLFAPLSASIIGAAAGYLAFRIIGEVFLRIRKIEGLGQGDAKLIAAIGAWLGWQALAPVVFIAAVTALLGALIIRPKGEALSRHTQVRFGPALCAAAAIVFIAGAGFDLPPVLSDLLPTYR